MMARAGIAPDAARIEHDAVRCAWFDGDRRRSATNCARCGKPCDRGPWREQRAWDQHAAFMDGLVEDGFIILGGPLGDGSRTLHVVEAANEQEIRTRMAEDPWASMDLLRVGSIEPWQLWLDGRSGTSEIEQPRGAVAWGGAVARRGDQRGSASARRFRRPAGQPVNGSRMWLKSQVFCVIPEHVLLSTVPGQPPLSRWIAQIDRTFMLLVWAKFSIVLASGS